MFTRDALSRNDGGNEAILKRITENIGFRSFNPPYVGLPNEEETAWLIQQAHQILELDRIQGERDSFRENAEDAERDLSNALAELETAKDDLKKLREDLEQAKRDLYKANLQVSDLKLDVEVQKTLRTEDRAEYEAYLVSKK